MKHYKMMHVGGSRRAFILHQSHFIIPGKHFYYSTKQTAIKELYVTSDSWKEWNL